jgi:hypothetical protein
MTPRWKAPLARAALGLVVLAATFVLMSIVLSPRASAPAPAPVPEAAQPGLGRHAQAVEEVRGVTLQGQVEAPAPTLRIVLPGLSTATAESIAAAEPSPEFLAFGALLQQTVDSYTGAPGRYAVAVTDLQTGHTAGAYQHRSQLSGCVMNFFVILQAVKDAQDGRYPLERVDALVRATIWSSNATTARELYRIVGDGDTVEGVRRVAVLHDALGLPEVLIDHPPAYGADSLGIDYNNWLTADAVNRALAALWRGEVLDPEHRTYLLEAMASVKPGLNYLVAHVPGAAVVSHKNGFFPSDIGYIDNDAGIVHVTTPSGASYAYAVTFLSEAVPWKYGDLALGQALMLLAWDYFAGVYGDGVEV